MGIWQEIANLPVDEKAPFHHVNRQNIEFILPKEKFGAKINIIEVLKDSLKATLGKVPLISVIGSLSYAFDENGKIMWDVISDFDIRIHTDRISDKIALDNQYSEIKAYFLESLKKLGINVFNSEVDKQDWGITDLTGRKYRVHLRAELRKQIQLKQTALPIKENPGPGGIDFRALPIANLPINTATLKLSVADLNRLSNINLNSEWIQIQNLVNAGIVPSTERIKEYVLVCCLRQGLDKEMDKVLGCIADIMRMEEDRVSDTDAQLKNMLVLIEAGKPENELQLGLSQIKISPQEPKSVVM